MFALGWGGKFSSISRMFQEFQGLLFDCFKYNIECNICCNPDDLVIETSQFDNEACVMLLCLLVEDGTDD